LVAVRVRNGQTAVFRIKALRANLRCEGTGAPGKAKFLVIDKKIATIFRAQGRLNDALDACRQGIAITQTLVYKDADNVEWQHDLWGFETMLGDILRDQAKLGDALDAYHRGFAIIQGLAVKSAGDQHWAGDLQIALEKLGTLSYRIILRQRAFDSALSVVDEAIALAPKSIWMYANCAHALMFLGREEEARAIYLQYCGRRISSSKSWEESILEDFAAFVAVGLERPLMDEIKAAVAPKP
jgi:tetratricopeptide (TPR) repeat protein